MVVAADLGQGGGHRFEGSRPGGTAVGQGDAQQLQTRAVQDEQLPAALEIVLGTELEQHPQMVGEFALLEQRPGARVGVLEVDQRGAALTGVAVAEVGQIQAAAPAEVERLHVLGLQVCERRRLQMVDQPEQWTGHRAPLVDQCPDQRKPLEQFGFRIVEQQ